MRKLFLIIPLLLLAIGNINAQGSDVIFCIDNSGSIDATEYTQMSNSVKALITNVLSCNSSNRVSVVHYGTSFNGLGPFQPKIFIESNFTNNATAANNFVRRLNSGDHFHEAIGFVGEALDNFTNAPNANIVSTQRQLSRNTGNNLVVFLFTDALRAAGDITAGSYLVNFNSSVVGTNAAFQNFTNFKNNRGARFVVVHVSTNDPVASPRAAASIASRGGSFNGIIEGYPLDPDGNNLPRLYINNGASFTLTPAQITTVSTDICTISIAASITLNSVNENCPLFPLNVTGNYTIPPGATISNIRIQIINSMGAVVSTILSPTITGNTFSFPVNLSNFGTASPMTGNFEFNVLATVTQGTAQTSISQLSANAGPDVSFSNCSDCCATCCVDNQSLTFPVLANFVDTRQANLRIHAVNTINSGAFASYHAGDLVLLKAGFVALSGSRVHVYNEGCTGTYLLRESSSNEGTMRDMGVNENLEPNKVEQTIVSNNIKLSPNPNSGIFKISLPELSEGTIQIVDLYGLTVLNHTFKNQKEIEINIQDKPKGIYIVKVISDNQIYTDKIIKN